MAIKCFYYLYSSNKYSDPRNPYGKDTSIGTTNNTLHDKIPKEYWQRNQQRAKETHKKTKTIRQVAAV